MKDILVGHCHNEHTGVSVIMAPKGAVGGVDVKGGSPGTRETDVLRTGNLVDRVNAIVLSGGSAYGLEASCGVMEYLRERKVGYNAGHVVPIVSGAVIYDLNDKVIHYPDKIMGYQACKNATENNFENGQIGGGRGATVGKIRGPKNSCRGGFGSHYGAIGGLFVEAYFVVNALGDIFDPRSKRIIAGARGDDGAFIDSADCILRSDVDKLRPSNTTIGVVVTNARINKEYANKLASICQNGLAKTINPVHTMFDGDTVFVMSTNEVDADFTMLSVLGVEAVSKAIINAVKPKTSVGAEGKE